jgi:hypothetical protein
MESKKKQQVKRVDQDTTSTTELQERTVQKNEAQIHP